MRTGSVKFFRADRGFGFIKTDDGSPDVFMHITALRQAGVETLDPGERVQFDTRPDRFGKGPLAISLGTSGSIAAPRKVEIGKSVRSGSQSRRGRARKISGTDKGRNYPNVMARKSRRRQGRT
jgi:cold shock protein